MKTKIFSRGSAKGIKLGMVLTLFFTFGSINIWGDVTITPLELPKQWAAKDGKAAYTNALGCSHTITGADYSTSGRYLRFDATGMYLKIQLADAPGTLTYSIQGQSFSSGTFKVQESEDDVIYTDVVEYTNSISAGEKEHTLQPTTRYIRFLFETKSTGNVAMGTVGITKAPTYNVEWWVGETKVKYENDVATSTPPSVSDGDLGGSCSDLEFVGWSATDIGSTPTTVPGDLFNGQKTLSGNSVYYAVFAEQLTAASETDVFTDDLNISGTGPVTTRSGWNSFTNANGGQGSLRLSTGSNAGSAVTNALASLTSATTTITFKIKAWDDDESGLVTLSTNRGTLAKTDAFTAPFSTYTTFSEVSTTITGGSSSTQITFTGTGGHRIYIKDLSIVCHTPATYSASSYQTKCYTVKHTVRWFDNGGQIGTDQEINEGSTTYSCPSDPDPEERDNCGVFVGWTVGSIASPLMRGTDDAAITALGLFSNDFGSKPAINDDTDFYAVFADYDD